ncbi:verrucotoxin subunit beta-like [Sardina pilchardus]|uniref:verrucotoxin subunit beta-like n=1 Tax=Sardina pilchardus TaxID=27697 RepID=UPI002E15C089
MASCGDDTMEMAALGRPFQLGMLYDCRKDALIPGITLWDQEQLQKNTSVQQQNKTEFNVTTSDTIDEKSNSLKISGSLKLSLLGGLVDVEGSARYFQDTKKSHKEARVTLQNKTTTKSETLTMSHLARGQVSHPNVFEDDTATHVVTAILYGAGAYFVFDRESSSEDKKKQVEEDANLTFNKLKFLTVDAEASLDMDESEKSAVEKLSCTFHGDFKLPTNPRSFSEAVRVYRDLPNMLGENGEHAVPLRVWLYPLCKLDSRAARLVRDISNDLIRYSSDTIESFTNTEMRCRDILRDTAAAACPALAKKVEKYRQMCHQYKLDFIQRLGSVLPSIRGGGKEESALLDVLKAHENSCFNSKDLDQWLTSKEKESDTLKSFLKQLKKLDVPMDVDLDDLLNDVDVRNVVSFSFTSLDEPDSFLLKLTNELKPMGMLKTSLESSDLQGRNNNWLSSDIRQQMRGQLKLFEELKKMSTSDDTKFIVDSKYDESHPGACIFIYEDGCDDAIHFVPPSKPATPTTTGVSHDSVTVQVSDPDSATVEYRVEYRTKQNQETEWKSHPVQKNQKAATLSGLKPETEYEIRATAVCKLSYAVSSDIFRVVTLRVVRPPNQLKVSKVKANSISLTWSIPSDQLCEFVKEYAIEYRTKQETEWKSHPVQKNQKAATLSGLKPETEYEIRATAVSKLSYAVNGEVGIVKTLTAVCPPNQLKVSKVKANSISLTWSIPSDQLYEFVKEYAIEYRTKQESEWKSHPVQMSQKAATLPGLKPETEYEIKVTAVSKLNYAVSSEVCSAITPTAVPSKPATPTTTDVSHDSVTVQVSDPDSATVEYRVEYREKQNQETEWKSHPVQRNQKVVTLSGLKPDI